MSDENRIQGYCRGFVEEEEVCPIVRQCETEQEFVGEGVDVGDDKSKSGRTLYWHGTPSGEMRGGHLGLHVGTYKAAEQALEARIGIPAEGYWDGTRGYGKTLMAGKKEISNMEKYVTGINCDAPEDDYFPSGEACYGSGTKISLDVKPVIFPVVIVGEMTNLPSAPHSDDMANALMKGQTTKGTAKRGYFYTNHGEDYGSISAVVPGTAHLERVCTKDQLQRIYHKCRGGGR